MAMKNGLKTIGLTLFSLQFPVEWLLTVLKVRAKAAEKAKDEAKAARKEKDVEELSPRFFLWISAESNSLH